MTPPDVPPAKLTSAGTRTPLLGRVLGTPQPSWETSLDRQFFPWLDDHRFRGRMVFPGMGYLDLGHAAGISLHPDTPLALHDVKFSRACLISENQPPTLQTILQAESGEFTVHGRRSAKAGWTLHARGFVRPNQDAATEPQRLTDIWDRCPIDLARQDCYRLFHERGLDYGPAFQGIDQMWRGQGECLARIDVPKQLKDADRWLHPATVDACLHVLLGAILPGDGSPSHATCPVYLPVDVAEVHVHAPSGETLWSHGRISEQSAYAIVADIRVFEETGRVVWEANGLRCQAMGGGVPEK